MAGVLPTEEIARELAPYKVQLPPESLEKLSVYLDLLMRWNRRINLTGLRESRAIVRTLFGESLFLAGALELRGRLVDVGSGAGFPGLAVKLAAPDLRVTLVESRQKKCAFLKEVARACRFSGVDVVSQRFEDWVERLGEADKGHIITTRAVEVDRALLGALGRALARAGRVALFTRERLAAGIKKQGRDWDWEKEERVPGGAGNMLLIGRRR